ncbi:MAG TPA: S41 family peptidase [Steroidobacteraceae bacterium]|nr:S41 family peptidase [Steroidobacteraceae bacterium]
MAAARTTSTALILALTLLASARAADGAVPRADPSATPSSTRPGYYRFPALHDGTIVFTAEGDLWTVGIRGGTAHRLTSNPGMEGGAAISPDGTTVAFSAQYEGPTDVYTMPIDGGLPERRTWDGDAAVAGWTPDGKVLVRTHRYSTLPEAELVAIDLRGNHDVLPLAQAASGSFTPDGKTLFFTRRERQPSSTKRYQGGTAESIWRYTMGTDEASALTSDWLGTSNTPMFWNGRVYFLSDRDGVMNVYSMDPQGHDVREHTHQRQFDVQSASLSDGRIVYQCGADLWLLDLATGQDAVIPIALASDFDQLRDHWVTKPLDYLTAAHLAPDGEAAVFTARGEVFTLAPNGGRVVKVAGDSSIRFREARYLPDGKSIVVLSTQTGETEFWKYPANGLGAPEQWTHDAAVFRFEGVPSPDSRWLAHRDKDQQLWLFDTKTRRDTRIAQSLQAEFADLSWSPDSQWLAYVETAANGYEQLKVLRAATGEIHALTTDRYDSVSPTWGADGKWLYFLSDRMLKTSVQSPWGPRQPDPYFDRSMKIYQLALTAGARSPFEPPDELHPAASAQPAAGGGKGKAAAAPGVRIEFDGLADRLSEVPAPPGNYRALQAAQTRLCWLAADDETPPKLALQCLDIDYQGEPAATVATDVKSVELSLDRKKLLVRKGDDFFILDADAHPGILEPKTPADSQLLARSRIDLSHWALLTNPRAEFREMFVNAWRLERDFFYDRHMNGVNWVEMRDRYRPLVERVTDRDELNDVIAQMVGELSALHIFVVGGDDRKPADHVDLACLGALLKRDEEARGFVVQHIYLRDPDLPDEAPPFARPDSLVHEGEVILSINGENTLAVQDVRSMLRGKVGQPVILQVKGRDGEVRDVLVKPISAQQDADLRYAEWEYSRRLKVDAESHGAIGYVHLRAMGPDDIEQWAREYYPVFDRQGLIIDVRHNRGGNIDSWLLGKLLRKAWFYWQPRIGHPSWNMQYAFRGHIVVLCDQVTASDGEAFSEGFKRLGLGKVIGMRTWGGEIWLSADTWLVDHGIATAAETGVYGPKGEWLIEGHGVDPDVVVDNLPHATYVGQDAQLEAAIDDLQQQIKADPRPVPPAPSYPDKSFRPSP